MYIPLKIIYKKTVLSHIFLNAYVKTHKFVNIILGEILNFDLFSQGPTGNRSRFILENSSF